MLGFYFILDEWNFENHMRLGQNPNGDRLSKTKLKTWQESTWFLADHKTFQSDSRKLCLLHSLTNALKSTGTFQSRMTIGYNAAVLAQVSKINCCEVSQSRRWLIFHWTFLSPLATSVSVRCGGFYVVVDLSKTIFRESVPCTSRQCLLLPFFNNIPFWKM